jgi:hypothetical protein
MEIHLTERDTEALKLNVKLNRVTIDQIYRMFFTDRTTAKNRVIRLIHAGYFTGERVPSSSGFGYGRLLLGIGPKGKEKLNLTRAQMKRMSHFTKSQPLDHHLRTADFYIDLYLDCWRKGIGFRDWVGQQELRSNNEKPEPDATFTLTRRGATLDLRLETDMDTEDKSQVVEKIRAYYKKPEDRRIVLWDVPSEKRASYLLQWIHAVCAQEQGDRTLHFVAVRPLNPLDAVWRVVGLEQPVSLIGGQQWEKT